MVLSRFQYPSRIALLPFHCCSSRPAALKTPICGLRDAELVAWGRVLEFFRRKKRTGSYFVACIFLLEGAGRSFIDPSAFVKPSEYLSRPPIGVDVEAA